MTRPSEITRDRILKAAERLFAEHGYDETSVRAIVAKARVNQAAINYHFAGKDGLYREVLRTAIHALTEQQIAHAQEMKAMSREAALGEFVHLAGLRRARLQAPGEPLKDFIVQEESGRGLPGLINLIGIESPGLTCAHEIAVMVTDLLRPVL